MSELFTYSILQYKYSLVLGEILNVGILFYFPKTQELEFVAGNSHRLRSIYPDFNQSLFLQYIQLIEKKITQKADLFHASQLEKGIKEFIDDFILTRDSAGLVFSDPVKIRNVFDSKEHAINEYSRILLPGIDISKPNIIRHNENFIIKRFTKYISEKCIDFEQKLQKNEVVTTKHLSLKFDFSWRNGSKNYIKPLSFDLSDAVGIQTKAATYVGYLLDLEDYASKNNARFDFLISKPQNEQFQEYYESAVEFLKGAKNTPKRLITEEQWEDYSTQAIEALSK